MFQLICDSVTVWQCDSVTQISSYDVDLVLREQLHLSFLLTADQRVWRKKIWEQVESIQLTPALGQGYRWTLKGQMIKRQEPGARSYSGVKKTREEWGNMTMSYSLSIIVAIVRLSFVDQEESKYNSHLIKINIPKFVICIVFIPQNTAETLKESLQQLQRLQHSWDERKIFEEI